MGELSAATYDKLEEKAKAITGLSANDLIQMLNNAVQNSKKVTDEETCSVLSSIISTLDRKDDIRLLKRMVKLLEVTRKDCHLLLWAIRRAVHDDPEAHISGRQVLGDARSFLKDIAMRWQAANPKPPRNPVLEQSQMDTDEEVSATNYGNDEEFNAYDEDDGDDDDDDHKKDFGTHLSAPDSAADTQEEPRKAYLIELGLWTELQLDPDRYATTSMYSPPSFDVIRLMWEKLQKFPDRRYEESLLRLRPPPQKPAQSYCTTEVPIPSAPTTDDARTDQAFDAPVRPPCDIQIADQVVHRPVKLERVKSEQEVDGVDTQQ